MKSEKKESPLMDYCKEHHIWVDITRKDVENAKKIKEIVEKLKLDGKSDVESASQSVATSYSHHI